MAPAPSWAAIFRVETAPRPWASANSIAARTICSRDSGLRPPSGFERVQMEPNLSVGSTVRLLGGFDIVLDLSTPYQYRTVCE